MIHKIGLLSGDRLDFGGVETHMLSLIRLLGEQFEFTLIAPASPGFIQQIDALGGHFIEWQLDKAWGFRAFVSLFFILKRNHISLIHIHSPRASFLGRLAALAVGIPALVTTHLPATDYFIGGNFFGEKILLWFYINLDRFLNCFIFTKHTIYVSARSYIHALKQKQTPPKHSVLIPNGIQLPSFSETYKTKDNMRIVLDTPASRTVIVFVGRLNEQKGLDVLLNAIRLLKNLKSDFELWIVGSGPQQFILEVLMLKLKIEGMVKFLGFRKDIAHILSVADIFVLPSRYEAMSIALLEGMAVGLPCIVTDVGDNALFIREGREGLVVPKENVTALASALKKLITNPELRVYMGRMARKKARNYGEIKMAKKTKGIYLSILRASKIVG